MLIVQLALISLGFLKKWRESKAYQKASHCIKHFTIKQHAATFFFFFTNCLVIWNLFTSILLNTKSNLFRAEIINLIFFPPNSLQPLLHLPRLSLLILCSYFHVQFYKVTKFRTSTRPVNWNSGETPTNVRHSFHLFSPQLSISFTYGVSPIFVTETLCNKMRSAPGISSVESAYSGTTKRKLSTSGTQNASTCVGLAHS